MRFAHGAVSVNGGAMPFEQLVGAAYLARVQLWSDGFYATPKVHWDAKTLTGHPFYYFAYGAAVSEVVVDTLTGEWKLVRADVLHDAGQSINPAIDIGQVEGGFIQGMGWLTTEELWWNRDGRLMTHAPSTYKIPAVSDTPAAFNVAALPQPRTPSRPCSARRRSASRRCCCRSRCFSRFATRSRRRRRTRSMRRRCARRPRPKRYSTRWTRCSAVPRATASTDDGANLLTAHANDRTEARPTRPERRRADA